MKKSILTFIILTIIVGCAGAIKVADEIKVADKIADKVDAKIAENVKVNPKATIADRSVNTDQKAGRDIQTTATTTNDTQLMEYIIKILGGIITCLIVQFIAILKWQGNFYNKLIQGKDTWIENLIKSNSLKDEKLDDWMRGRIDKQLNGKS